MRIIKQIEISRFRSISKEKIELSDLSVFSGLNNAGKSNILRALNLFFNGESGFKQSYNHSRDYNQAYTGRAGGRREIEIKILFSGHGKGALRKDFYISRKADEGGFLDFEYSYPNEDRNITDGNIRKQFTRFKNKLRYFYVPAIRDRGFVKDLFLYFEELLEERKGNDFRAHLGELSKILRSKSIRIAEDFRKFIDLETDVELSSNIVDILGSTKVNVKSGIEVRAKQGSRTKEVLVDLFSSGDGVLMSYIPHFLNYICENITGKQFIWGFEEPENSLEFGKVVSLSEKFEQEFKKNAQILITTYSPAFVSLGEKKKNKLFRVYIDPKDNKKTSKILLIKELNERQLKLFDQSRKETPEYTILEKELGFHLLNEKLFKRYQEHIREMEDMSAELKKIKRPVVISEGKNMFYLKKAKSFFDPDGEYDFHDGGSREKIKNLYQYSVTYPQPHKLVFLWDPDYTSYVSGLKKTDMIMPLCLVNKENYSPEGIESLFDEKWFTDDVIKKEKGKLPGTGTNLINKPKFMEKILRDANRSDFVQFENTFEELKKFFSNK